MLCDHRFLVGLANRSSVWLIDRQHPSTITRRQGMSSRPTQSVVESPTGVIYMFLIPGLWSRATDRYMELRLNYLKIPPEFRYRPPNQLRRVFFFFLFSPILHFLMQNSCYALFSYLLKPQRRCRYLRNTFCHLANDLQFALLISWRGNELQFYTISEFQKYKKVTLYMYIRTGARNYSSRGFSSGG